MALRISDEDLNPGQRHADNQFDTLKKAEEKGNNSRSADSAGDNSNSGNLNEAENSTENPENPLNYKKTAKPKQGGALGIFKRKGPIVSIATLLLASTFGLSVLFSPVMLPVTILANVVKTFDISATTTISGNRFFASKLSGSTTSGLCADVVNIFCKFERPSDNFLTQLGDNKIKAFDKGGKLIEKNLPLVPNTRPAYYEFTDSAGTTIKSTAKTISNDLSNNVEFRAAFHKAYNPRWLTLTGNAFRKVASLFGFNTTDKLKSTTDDQSLATEIDGNSSMDGEIQAASDAYVAPDGEANNAISSEEAIVDGAIEQELDTSTKKLTHAGKGGLVNLVLGASCMIADAGTTITRAVQKFQTIQLIRYGIVFLSAFGAIKAGDATPAEVSAIGDTLTKVVNGKSAMGGFGMNYVINDDKKASSDNYTKFIPGLMVVSKLSGINSVASSKQKEEFCKKATDPITGAAIEVALAETGVGLAPAVINALGGVAIGAVASVVLPHLIKPLIQAIPVDKIMTYFTGDLTKDLAGEDVGDALVSGASHVMSQTSNQSGNMPMSTQDAVGYTNLTKQIQLAYAEEDRATHSPFDVSSPNTMLGSIVQQLLPYFTKSSSTIGSMSGTLSIMSNVVAGSFGTIIQPLKVNAASSEASDFKQCDIPEIKDNDIAAGPFCNIIYGIPKQYLNNNSRDPVTVAKDLYDNGDIDIQGNPIKICSELSPTCQNIDKRGVISLESWLAICTDGSTDQAKNCVLDEKTADYSLYMNYLGYQQATDGTSATTTTTDTTGAAAQ